MILLIPVFLFLISCEERKAYRELSAINWTDSYEEALDLSIAKQKPVFLYFSAVWCSWCREYEKELENKRVSSFIERNFVPLILDSDRDRDHFLRFGGRGTPFTVILSYDERVIMSFHGSIKASDLIDVLRLALYASELKAEVQNAYRMKELSRDTYRFLLDYFISDLEERFDPLHGGFGSPTSEGRAFKWPTPLTYSYLLEKGLLLDKVLFSLRKDIELLYDTVDGGFFNFYDRTRAFDFYFETSKSLKINSKMILALLKAYNRTKEVFFLNVARGSASYLKNTLYHSQSGCFFNAQVSDPLYYNLSPKKRRERKPPPTDTALIVEDNSWAILAFIKLWQVTGIESYREIALRCAMYIKENLHTPEGLYRYYDVKKGKKGLKDFERDLALWALTTYTLLEVGEDFRDSLAYVLNVPEWRDWVSAGIVAFVLAEIDKNKAEALLKDLEINLHYHNPDDMVFLLKALEKLIEMG